MLKFIEKVFGLYKVTAQLVMTTYHYPVERKGMLTGTVQHRVDVCGDWVEGEHPKFKESHNEK